MKNLFLSIGINTVKMVDCKTAKIEGFPEKSARLLYGTESPDFYTVGLYNNRKSDISISAITIYPDEQYYLDNVVNKKFSPQCVQ